jgi:hypothetical protein
MAITTLDGYIASPKQNLQWTKTGARTTVAQSFFSSFDVAGAPGAGTLAAGNTANGFVPTDLTAGYPLVNAFGGSSTGYLTKAQVSSSVACRITLYDRLFVAGAYAFNANTALTAQPSYASRFGGPNAAGLELWVEQVTAATGNQAVTVTYTNEGGSSGRSTGAVGIGAAPIVGRCWQLPLQAGDSGILSVDNVLGTVATAGTFNVMVLRRLFTVRIPVAGATVLMNLLDTGMPEVYANSAFYTLIAADGTALGVPDIQFEVANG